tara:strand:- start:122 stop:448 length:327 start_codon:yes stop_codon:yes gene_type:complete
MKIRNIFTICLLSIFLVSCQGAKDAFQSKKRSNTNQEFLVEKKQPLTAPPDMNELPVPTSDALEDEGTSEDVSEVKKILEITENETNSQNSSGDNSTLENSILEKIKN